MKTRVKICGLTRLDDAQVAVDSGAWALGMIFYRDSPRACRPEVAATIARTYERKVELCGVFVNDSIDRIVRMADTVGLTMIQLHGDEGPHFANKVARRTGCKVVKALRVRDRTDVRQAAAYSADYYLFDTHKDGHPGGTGESFEWSLLDVYPSAVPMILGGGLNPDNVVGAIEQVRPYAVDVASGVEAYPGVKDRRLLKDFFTAVQSTDTEEEEEEFSSSVYEEQQ